MPSQGRQRRLNLVHSQQKGPTESHMRHGRAPGVCAEYVSRSPGPIRFAHRPSPVATRPAPAERRLLSGQQAIMAEDAVPRSLHCCVAHNGPAPAWSVERGAPGGLELFSSRPAFSAFFRRRLKLAVPCASVVSLATWRAGFYRPSTAHSAPSRAAVDGPQLYCRPERPDGGCSGLRHGASRLRTGTTPT